MLRSITDGAVSGTGTVSSESGILGGVLITTDGTNAATVVVRKSGASGAKVFDLSGIQALWCPCMIDAANSIYYSISGTGAKAQLFEFVA